MQSDAGCRNLVEIAGLRKSVHLSTVAAIMRFRWKYCPQITRPVAVVWFTHIHFDYAKIPQRAEFCR